MTYYTCLLICLFIFNCNNLWAQVPLKININTKQAELFLAVMQKIDSSKQKLYPGKNELSKNESELLREKLISNKTFGVLVDSLINHPVYNSIAKNVKCKIDSNLYEEKEAYRQVFYNLYDKSMRFTADMQVTWINFFHSPLKDTALLIIKKISNNAEMYGKEISALVKDYLPKNFQYEESIELYIGFDGNRGSINDGKIIFMDGVFTGFTNPELFKLTLAHETHHAEYGRYLETKYPKLNHLEEINPLLKWQLSIILEGTAQQINFDSYQNEAKELYNNNKLLQELYDEWIKLFRGYSNSINPKEYYEKYNNYYSNEFALKKINEYCPNPVISKKIISRRPSFVYYLGYNLFNTILLKGGTDSLINCVSEPESLLECYNKYMENQNIIPLIPNDMVKLWRVNFEAAK
ncbi:MAG: DUF5700 domain-containing putative Zn-dependent protease [bacterium]